PLRERGDDISLLANHFLAFYNNKYHKNIQELQQDALIKLRGYHFPGNVRELQYSIERAVIMAENPTIGANDILFSPIEQQELNAEVMQVPASHNLEEMERKTIKSAIERYNGNISKAAKELGLTRAALYRRLEKYNL
ncbi:MAG: helix-turn-helix domain-containing protein, partial [Sphingobacterium sp.]